MNKFGDFDPSYPSQSFGQPYGGEYLATDSKSPLMEFMPQESPRHLLEIHVSFITYRVGKF